MLGAAFMVFANQTVVALVSVLLALATFALLGTLPSIPVILVQATGTWLVYIADRGLPFSPEDEGLHRPYPAGMLWWAVLPPAVVGMAALTQLTPSGRWVVALLGLLGIGYVFPVLPGRRRIKDLPFAKTVVVATGWSTACVLLPVVGSGQHPQGGAIALFAYRFAYLLPNVLVSDWPDRDEDRRRGIRTVANSVSAHQMVGIHVVSSAVAAILAGLFAYAGLLPAWIVLEIPCLLVACVLVSHRLPGRHSWDRAALDGLVGWPGLVAGAQLLSHLA